MINDFNLDNEFYYAIADGRTLKINYAPHGIISIDDDPGRQYIVNSYGYRGEEFSSENNLVVAGCSFTYGLGVPEEAIWGNVVARELGLRTGGLVAKPGASVSVIVEKIFSYFHEFGHPEYLLCLFPDAHRFAIPLDGKILDADHSNKNPRGELGTYGTGRQRILNDQSRRLSELQEVKYIKRPYNIKDIYTPEMGLYESIRSIRVLEQYCNQAGIKFIWSTWDGSFSTYMEKINSIDALKFNNFFDLSFIVQKKLTSSGYKYLIYGDSYYGDDSKHYKCYMLHGSEECSCADDCHQDLILKYGEKNFYIGTDSLRGEDYAHPGIHAHVHYAERFIEELVLRYPHDFK